MEARWKQSVEEKIMSQDGTSEKTLAIFEMDTGWTRHKRTANDTTWQGTLTWKEQDEKEV